MTEGRRHSVDIPFSKTLVALKRVRSLRDPSTNSMSKFAVAFDNVNWEVNSCVDAYIETDKLDKSQVKNSFETENISKSMKKRNAASKKSTTIRIKGSRSKRTISVRQSCPDGSQKSLQQTEANPMEEEVDSCSGTYVNNAEEISREVLEDWHCGCRRTTKVREDVGLRRAESPCLSINGLHTNLSSKSATRVSNHDDGGVVNSNYSGCGISYCWSITPKYKDAHFSDIENQELPLLSAEWRCRGYRDATSMPESTRSLSQKFRPKSFSELVGLNVVTKSLMHAVTVRKVAPLYLFHGPRGTGKTSTARIFAAALNCLSLEDNRPCNSCQECVLLFSGQSRDVKELCASNLNHKYRMKALLKSASFAPFASQFKVFIIEECHFLRVEIWSAILNNVEENLRHTVFVMITSSPDKLRQSLISQCQRYHFPKIKDDDIIFRLQKICIEEGFVFDMDALAFISSKADGSVQNAETMLDQLALLGKKITVSLTHELIGVVSNEELLDLLDLALSADTRNTVRRARELMMSRIDPMQLVSQLANLIMDILAGRYQSEFTKNGKMFFRKHAVAQASVERLKHILKILSDTEKQLRTSTNQATWLTVALLQFGTNEPSLTDLQESMEHSQTTLLKDRKSLDSFSSRAIQSNFVCYGCNKLNCSGRHCNRAKLVTIWKRALMVFQSGKLRSFLHKWGNLSALHFSEDLAIVTIGFSHPDHVTKAEKSWKPIAISFQNVLGCHVEIRIKLLSSGYKKKRKSFSFLSCSGGKQETSESSITEESTIETVVKKDPCYKSYLSNLYPSKQLDGDLASDTNCFHDKEIPSRSTVEETGLSNISKPHCQVLKEPNNRTPESHSFTAGEEALCLGVEEAEITPNCFARVLERQKRLLSSSASHMVCLRVCSGGNSEFSMTKNGAEKAYFSAYDPYNNTPASNALIAYKSAEDRIPNKDSRFRSRLLCWKASISSPSYFPAETGDA